MSLGKIALLGAGFWAYRAGYFDAIIARYNEAETVGSFLQTALADPMSRPQIPVELPVIESAVYAPIETVEAVALSDLSKEEKLLQQHWYDVQPWARANKTWVAAMIWQESRGNPNATSHAGARGLMQVVPGTQEWMHNLGYDRYRLDAGELYDPGVSIYFGTAFLQYLSTQNANRDWMTRAYNAGPGGQRDDGTWPSETVNYLASIKRQFEKLTT